MAIANRYDVIGDDESLIFNFTSTGPKGKIAKQVIFSPFTSVPDVYNLGFGDLNESGEINDMSVSDNGDSKAILATIAFCATLFLEVHPYCSVYAQGSTTSRTRLYRMGISVNIDDIGIAYAVFGYNGEWETFSIGKEYEAFLIRKKHKFVLP